MAKDTQEKQTLLKWPAKIAIGCIRAYQLVLSPWVGHSCRFTPTCSQYAIEAYQTCGFFKASWLSCKRLAKCHPWHKGGIDNVPAHCTKTKTKTQTHTFN